MLRSTRSDALVLLLTATATIAFDLIVAVEIGVAVAVLLALRHVARNSGAEIEPLSLDETVTDVEEARLLHEHIVVYRLDGSLFFGAAQWFLTELTAVTRREGRDPAPFCGYRFSMRPARKLSARSSANSNREESLSC